MVELQNINYHYGDGTEALIDVSLSLSNTEKMVVAGANGAGKSTLFKILNGLLKPNSGKYIFENREVKHTKQEVFYLHKNIGLVFQEPDNQLFAPSVYHEVAFGPLNLKLSSNEVKRRVDEALHLLDIENLIHKPTHSLSYGQKKRVAIASVLAMQPRLIVFDEPTAGLDPIHAANLVFLLDKLHNMGQSIVISTHDMNLAYQWANRIVLLKDGKIVADGNEVEVFGNKELVVQCGLELPMLFQIFNAFNKSDVKPPKTIDNLIHHLKLNQCEA